MNVFATLLYEMGPQEPAKGKTQLTKLTFWIEFNLKNWLFFDINQPSILFNKECNKVLQFG